MFYLYHNNLDNVQNIGYSGSKFANSKILHCSIAKYTAYIFSYLEKMGCRICMVRKILEIMPKL